MADTDCASAPAAASAAPAASYASSASASAASARSEAWVAVDAVTSATADEARKESYWWLSASEVLPIVTVRSISDSIPSASTTAESPCTWVPSS